MLLSLRSLWEGGEPPVEGTADATLYVAAEVVGTFSEPEPGFGVEGAASALVTVTAEAIGDLDPAGTVAAFVGLEAAAGAQVGVSGSGAVIVRMFAESYGLGEPLDPILGEALAAIHLVGQAVGTAVEQEAEPELPDTGGFRISRPGFLVPLKRPIRGDAKAKVAAIEAGASGTVGIQGRVSASVEIELSAQGVHGVAGLVDGIVVALPRAKGDAQRWSAAEREILMLLAEAA